MRRLIVGDIHGCYDELLELLALAHLEPGDEVIAVGDLIGRGPRSGAVLALFGALDGPPAADAPASAAAGDPAGRMPRLRAIMGNHELRHVRVQAGEIPETNSVRKVRQEMGDAAWRQACAWMRRLPPAIALPEALVVHALWEPGVPRERQRPEVLVGDHEAEEELVARLGDRPWYELYDGQEVLVCGHHDYGRTQQPLVVRDRVYAIDTGCVYGGRLTALLLPGFRFLSVPSHDRYYPPPPADQST